MGVRGYQPDSGQAAGYQIGEERVPRRTDLTARNLHPERFTAPIRVAPVATSMTALSTLPFTRLHRQRGRGHQRERASLLEEPVAELFDLFFQVHGHARDLGLRERMGAKLFDELVHAAGADTGEVAVGYDGDHRGLSAFAPLEQPFRKVGALPEFEDRDVHSPGPGIQIAMPVPPLRCVVRAGVLWPYSAPTTSSASAESSALIMVCSI